MQNDTVKWKTIIYWWGNYHSCIKSYNIPSNSLWQSGTSTPTHANSKPHSKRLFYCASLHAPARASSSTGLLNFWTQRLNTSDTYIQLKAQALQVNWATSQTLKIIQMLKWLVLYNTLKSYDHMIRSDLMLKIRLNNLWPMGTNKDFVVQSKH